MTAGKATRQPARPAQRLTIWLGVRDRHRHASLGVELLKRARRRGLAGATVFEGRLGYGAGGRVHREHLLADDRPLSFVVVDSADKIAAFLVELDGLAHGLAATVDNVEIVDT